ncbi:cation:proton antiporter [Longispora albida]|uniref:cation:proton antiporter n=1 Tax=Longispora albida TaxID=203523 RepID=UPI00035D4C98|nr:cation:proton antiporter [Longispora albida]
MTAHQVGQLLLALAGIILLARAFGWLARKCGQPPVIGEILAGILIGPTLFGSAVTGHLLPDGIRPALSGLASVGLVLFMFIVGYELDTGLVRGRVRVAVSVSIGSIVLPFGLGFALALWLAGRHGVTDTIPFALFVGAAMSVTAFPVLARILTDRGMHRLEVGGLALASAAVDDVLAWTLLAGIVTLGGGGAGWQILLSVPYVLVMFLVVRPLLAKLAAARARAGRLTPDILGVILAGLLLSCFATEWLGVHAIFGAFLFGAVMPRDEVLRHEILERLEQVSVLLLLPAFFVLSGMKVDLSTVNLSGFAELVLILAVAIAGKFAGAYLGARLQQVPAREAGVLATLMNTRGLTEIVILTVGLQLGLLDGELFSLMVVMALVTTVMAGPLLSALYPRSRVAAETTAADQAGLALAPGTYRVLLAVPEAGPTPALAQLGADLAGGHARGELVLSALLPYRSGLEVGTGLSGELLEMTRVMGELEAVAAPLRSEALAVPVLARFAEDPAAELARQVAATGPDLVLTTGQVPGGSRLAVRVHDLPGHWDTVVVDDRAGPAARALGAAIAAQVTARSGGSSGHPLVIGPAGRQDVHLSVHLGGTNSTGETGES